MKLTVGGEVESYSLDFNKESKKLMLEEINLAEWLVGQACADRFPL